MSENRQEYRKPVHYNFRKQECIVEMAMVFGIEAVETFCKLNVWKYRYRVNSEIDAIKADEYIQIIKEINEGTFWKRLR